jgi:hypothetical protein
MRLLVGFWERCFERGKFGLNFVNVQFTAINENGDGSAISKRSSEPRNLWTRASCEGHLARQVSAHSMRPPSTRTCATKSLRTRTPFTSQANHAEIQAIKTNSIRRL